MKEISSANPPSPFSSIKCAEFRIVASTTFAWWNSEFKSRNCSWMSDIENHSMKSEHVPFFCCLDFMWRDASNFQRSHWPVIETFLNLFFSADWFFQRKQKILFDINIIASLFRAFECSAHALYNEKKNVIEGGGIVPISTINNLFSISRRDGRVQLFVNYKLFSHLNGINEKRIGRVCGALFHFHHSRLTHILLSTNSSCLIACLPLLYCITTASRIGTCAQSCAHRTVTSYSAGDIDIEQVAVDCYLLSRLRKIDCFNK